MRFLRCTCGQLIDADSGDELLTRVEEHIAREHDELVGQESFTQDDTDPVPLGTSDVSTRGQDA